MARTDEERRREAETLFKKARSAHGSEAIHEVIYDIQVALEDEYGQGRGDEARNEP